MKIGWILVITKYLIFVTTLVLCAPFAFRLCLKHFCASDFSWFYVPLKATQAIRIRITHGLIDS